MTGVLCSVKMLYLIGLGLGDVKDITVKGLEIVKRAHKIYLEAYTSILVENKEKLVRLFILNYTFLVREAAWKKLGQPYSSGRQVLI